jgi:signal transduction histidine kinase
VVDVVRDVLDGFRRDADEHGVRLVMAVPERAKVASSVGVLTSIVSNLVQNAIKHMDGREPSVVTVRAALADHRVHVEVEDTGPGVPPAIAGSIFEPFVRGTSEREGLGLGLATVRQLVSAHGGDVGLRATPQGGSVFWFDLPSAV